jgi:uncharacterized protein YndB with AHSA1/START domain
MMEITTGSDPKNLSMTLTAEFDAAPEQVWSLWADPRKLERWYGPEPYPAIFTRYEFMPGGQCRYYMTGPDDFLHHGWWRIDALAAPSRIEFVNGLAGDDGEPVPGLEPVAGIVTFEPTATGTRMTVRCQFADAEQMEQLAMGMQEGMRIAIGQIAALLDLVHTT